MAEYTGRKGNRIFIRKTGNPLRKSGYGYNIYIGFYTATGALIAVWHL